MPASNNLRAHLALLAVAIIYSCNFIIAQDVMKDDFVPPLALVFFRVMGACTLFWIFHLLFIKEQIKWKDVPYFILCSFIGILIAQNTFLIGLEKTPAINASLIISTTPVMVAFFSVFILKETLTKNKIIGLILAAIGTFILLSAKGAVTLSSEYFTGNLLIFINAATYGLYLVMIKPLLRKYNPITVVKWVFTFSIPMISFTSYESLLQIEWESFTRYAWIGLIYVVLFATFLTYAFNAYAIQKLSPVIAGLYLYVQPFITATISVSFGKDTVSIFKVIAGIFILTGLYFAIRPDRDRDSSMD